MPFFQHILFPVDFSERSDAAAPFVLSMAQRNHARVTTIHVVQPAPPIYGAMNSVYPDTIDYAEIQNILGKRLREFAEKELPKVETVAVVEVGDPAAVITEYANANQVDLIAMPTHGYGAFRRMLLGSVTAKVLHDATVPVWTAAHAPEPTHRAHPLPRHIVVALDLRPESRVTMARALELAQNSGADLEILHVAPEGETVPEAAERRVQDVVTEVAREQVVKVHQETGGEPDVILTGGSVASYWRPTRDNCLGRISRDRLLVVARDTIGEAWANSRASEKKALLVDQLDRAFADPAKYGRTPEQVDKLKSWLPTGMAFGSIPTPKPAKAKKARKAA